VAAQQVHDAKVHVVTPADTGRGALDWESAIPATDALIVAAPQIPAMILVADCAPLLLVDARQRVLAVVHAGWRGAVAGVAGVALERMRREFGSSAAEIRVGIGPCLCTDCFVIGEEVAAAARRLAPDSVHRRQPKPHLDLRALLARDLTQAGVPGENIEILPQCPRCDNEAFFSHRAQGGTAGRCGVVAWWE
jgi:YfiH family protein